MPHDPFSNENRTSPNPDLALSTERELLSMLEERIQQRTRQLEGAKRAWEQTFDAIGEPVMLLDQDHRIKRANLALSKTVQGDIRQMIGQKCHEILMGRPTPCEQCPLLQTFQHQTEHTAELTHANDKTIYHVRSFPMPENPQQVVHIYRDLTEEKELQNFLVQSEKLNTIGMLAGQVAHELNNPLAAILAQAQLLLMDCEDEPQLQPRFLAPLREIEKASLRCRRIIQDLLNFSRQTPTTLQEQCDLNNLIQQSVDLYRLLPPRQGPELKFSLTSDLPLLRLDPNKMQSVFLNLLSNAKAATPVTGTISVETSRQENEILIVFQDTGSGIPPNIQEKIFTPFFTTKPPGLGTGLGLYITQQIIKEHKGTITLQSEEGRGTTFRIRLPFP